MYLYREYIDKNFYVYLKKANKMYLVAMILSIISFIVYLIYFILDCIDIADTFVNLSFSTYYLYFYYDLLFPIIYGLLIPISFYFGSKNIKKVKYKSKIWKKYNVESKFFNDSCTLLLIIIGSYILLDIFMIIASVYLIKCYKIVKKDYLRNPPEYMKGKIEAKRKEQQAKRDNAVLQNYLNLIEIAGKKFFLKNYYIIRDLSFADAMDSIEDKYSYEDKEKRVQAVKRIFSLNLQKFALEKIIQESTGDINVEIKAEAEDIYKKEFPEIITDTITESVAEETEDNKPKEIT